MMFKELFKGIRSKPEAVASFLAVLELIKMKKIKVEYNNDNGDISNPKIYRTDNNPEMNLDFIEE